MKNAASESKNRRENETITLLKVTLKVSEGKNKPFLKTQKYRRTKT